MVSNISAETENSRLRFYMNKYVCTYLLNMQDS